MKKVHIQNELWGKFSAFVDRLGATVGDKLVPEDLVVLCVSKMLERETATLNAIKEGRENGLHLNSIDLVAYFKLSFSESCLGEAHHSQQKNH